jgi:benzaldehyde dehydrogenase (NAD)
MSTERIVVDAKIADEFVGKLAARAKSLPLGDPRLGPVVLGSVVDMSTVERCNALIDDALAKGATLLCGGKADSTLMPATILDHVTPKMRIYHEESFGPVTSILRADDAGHALAIANDTAYGLSSAIITNDLQKAFDFALRSESGMVHINDTTIADEPHIAFGGVKGSGFGREGGRASIEEMTELKWVTVQMGRRAYPF